MPNIHIPHFKEYLDRPRDGGAAYSYTIGAENDVTITGSVAQREMEMLIQTAKAAGYRPKLVAGALHFTPSGT